MHTGHLRMLATQNSRQIPEQFPRTEFLKHANIQQTVVEFCTRENPHFPTVIPAIANQHRHAGHAGRNFHRRVNRPQHFQPGYDVTQWPDFLFQFQTHRANGAGVEANTGELHKIAFLSGKLRTTEIDGACSSGLQHAPRSGKIRRNPEFFCENVHRPERQNTERLDGDSVDDFVNGAIATGGDNQIVIPVRGREFRGVTGTLRWRERDIRPGAAVEEAPERPRFRAAGSRWIENYKYSFHAESVFGILGKAQQKAIMRIIAGLARGLTLAVPRGDATRPTSDRVREAIFSSLGARVPGANVLDLFAGTGALGLEALSRGAQSAVFVENARTALDCLAKNLTGFKPAPVAKVVRGEVLRELARLTEPFNLIFADPPYGTDFKPILETVRQRNLLAADGLFVLESAKRDVVVLPAEWRLHREAVYGDTRVSYVACG